MHSTQISNAENYAPYKAKQDKLNELLRRACDALAPLGVEHFSKSLESLRAKTENDSFKIQIVGNFKNGKSTFINSFLGEEILPAYALPCTAVINEVKYGAEKCAVLHFREQLDEDTRVSDIPERALKHMQAYDMVNVPPMDIPYDEIEDYVVIPIGKDQKEAIKESPYKKVELFWPLELLKNGVEIIDSPGLNEAESRTKVTTEYLTHADAIIFLLRSDALCSKDEMDFVEYNLRENGFDSPFFVVNRFDIIPKRQRQGIKDYAHMKLDGYTKLGDDGFFFVSALNALDAKIDGDEQLYIESGMPQLEKKLSLFLTQGKGVVKLSQPAREIKRVLSTEALGKLIPERTAMLEASLDDMKKRCEEVKPRLENLRKRNKAFRDRLKLQIEMAMREVRDSVKENVSGLSRQIPEWADEFKPDISLRIPTKEKIKRASREIAEHVSSCAEKAQIEWKNKELIPLAQKKSEEIFSSIEYDVQLFFAELDSINRDVSRKYSDGIKSEVWERVGNTELTQTVNYAHADSRDISKEFANTIALSASSSAIMSIIEMFDSFTLGNVLIAELIKNFKNADAALKDVRKGVSTEMIRQLNAQKEYAVDATVRSSEVKFEQLATTVIQSVEVEIKDAKAQMQSVIDDLEKGRESAAEKKLALEKCEKQLKQIVGETDEFIYSLLG